jgi:hypothetical protein
MFSTHALYTVIFISTIASNSIRTQVFPYHIFRSVQGRGKDKGREGCRADDTSTSLHPRPISPRTHPPGPFRRLWQLTVQEVVAPGLSWVTQEISVTDGRRAAARPELYSEDWVTSGGPAAAALGYGRSPRPREHGPAGIPLGTQPIKFLDFYATGDPGRKILLRNGAPADAAVPGRLSTPRRSPPSTTFTHIGGTPS